MSKASQFRESATIVCHLEIFPHILVGPFYHYRRKFLRLSSSFLAFTNLVFPFPTDPVPFPFRFLEDRFVVQQLGAEILLTVGSSLLGTAICTLQLDITPDGQAAALHLGGLSS